MRARLASIKFKAFFLHVLPTLPVWLLSCKTLEQSCSTVSLLCCSDCEQTPACWVPPTPQDQLTMKMKRNPRIQCESCRWERGNWIWGSQVARWISSPETHLHLWVGGRCASGSCKGCRGGRQPQSLRGSTEDHLCGKVQNPESIQQYLTLQN